MVSISCKAAEAMEASYAFDSSSVFSYGCEGHLPIKTGTVGQNCGRRLLNDDRMTRAADHLSTLFLNNTEDVERPERAGVSGVYIIREDKQNPPLAVFKPRDEEMMDDSDKVLADFQPGFGVGREAAAFLLDRGGFIGVPETRIAKAQTGASVKEGMLQVFVHNVGDVDDFGPSVFDVEDVQKVAAFDLRVLNADRHGGNLLVSYDGERYSLRPIDHGMILPDTVRTLPWPVWMSWGHAKKPLTRKVKEYILKLDVDADIEMLKAELGDYITDNACDALRCGTSLLKICAGLDMTLYEIGLLVYTAGSVDNNRSCFETLLLSQELLTATGTLDIELIQFEEAHHSTMERALLAHPELSHLLEPCLKLRNNTNPLHVAT